MCIYTICLYDTYIMLSMDVYPPEFPGTIDLCSDAPLLRNPHVYVPHICSCI